MMKALREVRVERQVVVRASVERVFAALTDGSLFPTWGPERIEGKLAPGERPIFDFGASGRARVFVVALEPPHHFAYRWVQGVTDPEILLGDPLKGPNTLVEFHVDTVDAGTRVRVVESGMAPAEYVSDEMLEHMGKGWELMLSGLPRHFASIGLQVQDRIENQIVVRAPIDRVYSALTQLDSWWAEKVEGKVAVGERPILDFGSQFGRITIHVVAADAPTLFSYRWVQGVDDPARRLDDPRNSPSTLVEFRLESVPEGTRVHQSESGFATLATDDLAKHFKRAHQGWGIILGLLEMHFATR